MALHTILSPTLVLPSLLKATIDNIMQHLSLSHPMFQVLHLDPQYYDRQGDFMWLPQAQLSLSQLNILFQAQQLYSMSVT